MNRETAVEWLADKILAPYANINEKEERIVLTPTLLKEVLEKAKEIERNQIVDAWMDGVEGVCRRIAGETYYNRIYKGGNNE